MGYDVVVVGGGVVGASTAFHLAKLGKPAVCLVERSEICSGGTARSCAIVRSHYSIASNTLLTLKSLEMFACFRDWLEDEEAACGFVESGYLILAGAGGLADRMRANLKMQAGVGADTHEIAREEALERHPLLSLEDVDLIGYEPKSGYADPYLTTTGFARAARRKGVTVRSGLAVESLLVEGSTVRGVMTAEGPIEGDHTVLAIGPWSAPILMPLGIDVPLETSRHIVLTFRAEADYGADLPVVKDLTTANKMYFRPSSGGVVLVGTGDHGDPITGPEEMDENVGDDFVLLQGRQLGHRMGDFREAGLAASWVGAYDITPDWNPVLGPIEGFGGLTVAFGFSGHGFKLAPALGKVLAQSVLGEATDVGLEPYRLSRFAEGRPLTGAYGIGSIS